MLSFKQRGIKFHFSKVFGMTWTRIEPSNHLIKTFCLKLEVINSIKLESETTLCSEMISKSLAVSSILTECHILG